MCIYVCVYVCMCVWGVDVCVCVYHVLVSVYVCVWEGHVTTEEYRVLDQLLLPRPRMSLTHIQAFLSLVLPQNSTQDMLKQ